MISLYDSVTFDFLPEEMKTPEYEALCFAMDNQIKKFMERRKRVHIWANLEDVADEHLDTLAVECRVLFYNSDLAPDIKRKLVLNSMYWYMKLGTSQAMQEMIDIVFQNNNTTVEEWYSYSGEPFHFMVAVDSNVTQISITEFLQYLNTIKNARSRFDYLILQDSVGIRLTTYKAFQKLSYTFCGDLECGTYPNTEIGLQMEDGTVGLEGGEITGSTVYEETGTYPDIAVGLQMGESQVLVEEESAQFSSTYPDNETISGTNPDTAVGFGSSETGVNLAGTGDEAVVSYLSDPDMETGSYPDPATGLVLEDSSVEVEPVNSDLGFYYNPASEDDFAGED